MIEYIIIGLLIITIILLIVLLLRKNNYSEITEKVSRTEISVIKEIGDFKHEFSSDMNKDFNQLNDRIERKLNLINQKVNEKLEMPFNSNNPWWREFFEFIDNNGFNVEYILVRDSVYKVIIEPKNLQR